MSEPTPERTERAYPPDEFDDIQAVEGRRGAHRARPNPVLAMLPVLLVVVAVVAVVVGAMTLLGNGSPDAPLPAATQAAPNGPQAGQEDDPAPTGTAGPADTASPPPAEPTDPPATSAPDQTAEPEPPVDTSAPVTVLNGTRTRGLAGAATERLRAEGWTVPRAANYRDGDPPPTTVYYPSEELSATAAAVAEALGGAATELTDGFDGPGLTVVLGEDYQP